MASTTSVKPKVKPDRCGECTLCCYLLKVPEINKEPLTDCVHCVVKKGCNIWNKRPQVCRDYECAYYQMEKVHVDLRPDNCKVIFEKLSDRIFLGTQDPRSKATEVAKKQVASFNHQGFSVIVIVPNKSQNLYLAPNHNKHDIHSEYQSIIKKKYGPTLLHN